MTSVIAHKVIDSARIVSRQSLAWLLVVQVMILAPHFVAVPIWIAAVWAMVAFWRWKIFQGAWSFPNKIHKSLLVVGCCVCLYISMGAGFRFESMVSLLLVGFSLKLLELKYTKDFVLLIFIALFIVAAQFIQFNHFLAAFYGFCCLVLLCACLMQLYRKPTRQSVWQDLRPSLFILLQAIPFMVILFVVMPRAASFWAISSPQQSKTGMSDSMSPGDFTDLMESDALAFRVIFTGAVPAREKLYWRSLVFSLFDGRTWSQANEQKAEPSINRSSVNFLRNIDFKDDLVEYDIVAEASGHKWLYTLEAPKRWPDNLVFSRDMRLASFAPVNERIQYHVVSVLDYQLNEFNVEELALNTRLPANGNAKTRERAQQWLAETGSPEKLIEKLFAYYHQRFFYTLKTPALGVDIVDDFLWDSRQGFCEHFASSFVFFMRAAGVPARVVVGYQGGDINSVDGSLRVRQRDAHAWAEVWLDGRGWVRFDPTAAVAPERVHKGIEQSLSATDRGFLAKSFGSSFKIIRNINERWDAANLTWVRWVMNYDSSLQASLLERIIGSVSPLRIVFLVLMIFGGIGVFLFLILVVRNPKRDMSDTSKMYRLLCKKLKVCGFAPFPSETPKHFVARVLLSRPDLSDSLNELINLYELFAYGERKELAAGLYKAIKSFRPKTK